MIDPADGYCGRQVRRVRAQVARQHPVRGREVVAVVVMHRPDDRQLVQEPGVPWQEFRDLHARHGRRDRLERPAKLGGRIGLGVIRLMLGRPAVEPDHDHRSLAVRRGRRGGRGRPRPATGCPVSGPLPPGIRPSGNPRRLKPAVSSTTYPHEARASLPLRPLSSRTETPWR